MTPAPGPTPVDEAPSAIASLVPVRSTGSLRRIVTRLFFAILGLTVLAAVLGGTSLYAVVHEQHTSSRVTEPALAGSRRLLLALVDQETSVRGYVLTADPVFLLPYDRGVATEASVLEQLRRLLRDKPPQLALLDEIGVAANAWTSQHAELQIAKTRAGDDSAKLPTTVARGKALFDVLRSKVDALDGQLRADRLRGDRSLRTATNRLEITLGATVAVLLGIVIGAALIVQRRIVRPLDAIGDDVRLVIGGDLDHEVAAVGPNEVADLGLAVEAMRRSAVTKLAEAATARAEADARSVELARSNAELEQFAYVASHDLQEPLRKVASFCQLLQKRYGGQLDERADQYLDFAVDGAKRMQVLISDLLSFSRVGRTTDRFALIDLQATLSRIGADLADLLAEADGRLVVADDLPEVQGDPTLVTALFTNLVANAAKFRRPDVPPTIEVGWRPGDDGFVELWVRDDGIGIEPRFAERVFVIFQRLHGRDEYDGTGIGLALCRKIVEFHGGRIWVETDRPATDPGTTIHWTLPGRDAAAPSPIAASPTSEPSGGSPTVAATR